MTSPIRLGGAAALALTATLGLTSVAGASAGAKSFEKTYPVASRLCANIAKGAGPKRLRKSATQVLADCTSLQSSFNAAGATVLSTDASIASARAAEHALTKARCAGKLEHRQSCVLARHRAVKVLAALERQRIHAARAYYAAVESARRSFWTAIHMLPGGGGLHADAPIPEQSV
jgi:hypothetical protein